MRDPLSALEDASATREAYDALAPYYDTFTHGYAHARWLAELEQWASAEGVHGSRLLDVACGTGKSFEPMLQRGYEVTACDLSPQMVSAARRRAAGKARVVVADMRALPWRRAFDLVTCINDAINYLLTGEDLMRALRGMARALAPGGAVIFDANALMTYRTAFASRSTYERDGCIFRWEGSTSKSFRPGNLASAKLTVVSPTGSRATRHVQRHWPAAALRSACRRAGFDRVMLRGQLPGAELVGTPDEECHPKLVCLAVRGRATCEDPPDDLTALYFARGSAATLEERRRM